MSRPCVLVTRPEREAEALAEKLLLRGFAVVSHPLLRIRPRPAALADGALADGVQAVLLTSANGAKAGAESLGAAAWARLKRLPLFAVGKAAAAAARRAGFQSTLAPSTDASADDADDAGAAALCRLIRRRLRPEGGGLLHLSGGEIAYDLAPLLAPSGFRVRRVVVYDALPVKSFAPCLVRALREERVAACLFFSPRSARIFTALAKGAGLVPALASVEAFCLSPAVARALGVPCMRKKTSRLPQEDVLIERLMRDFPPPPAPPPPLR